MDVLFMLMSVIIRGHQYVAHSKINILLVVNMSLVSVFLILAKAISRRTSNFTVLPTKAAACAAVFYYRARAARAAVSFALFSAVSVQSHCAEHKLLQLLVNQETVIWKKQGEIVLALKA